MHSTSRNLVARVKQVNSVLSGSSLSHRQDNSTAAAAAAPIACPHLTDTGSNEATTAVEWNRAIPYDKVPGPKPIPILGNTFR